jgi:hypothetical protein
MGAASIKLRNRVLKPKELVRETYENGVMVEISDCDVCKHAICSPNGIYCGKLKEHVGSVASCPYFDSEPLEYKLYRRS